MELFDKKIGRRDFLKAGAFGAAAVAAAGVLPGVSQKTASAAPRSITPTKSTFSAIQKMTTMEMAKTSPLHGYDYDYLMNMAKNVKDPEVRKAAIYGLTTPMPKIMPALYADKSAQEATRLKLVDAGFIKSDNTIEQLFPTIRYSLQFEDGFGAGWGGHHAYPGGVVTHVATDLQAACYYFDIYEENFGYSMRKDLFVNAILLHDVTKPWIFQYKEDRSVLPEIKVGGTGCHHIQAIADVMLRGFDPDLVVCLADSHDHPGNPAGEAKVVHYLKSAAIIAHKDPIKEGYLSATDKIRAPHAPEGYLVNFGDGDWVLTSMVAKVCRETLAKVAQQDYKLSAEDCKGIKFNNLRNYVFAQMSDMRLYQILVEQGYDGFRKAVLDIVVPD